MPRRSACWSVLGKVLNCEETRVPSLPTHSPWGGRLAVFLALLVILGGLSTSARAQVVEPPPIEWEGTFGGPGLEFSADARQTPDGGYIGAAQSLGVYVFKTDREGNLLWEKTSGGLGGQVKEVGVWAAVDTFDGGYVVAGCLRLTGMDFYLLKTDSDGELLWEKTFGEAANEECARSIQETFDGGLIVAGNRCQSGSRLCQGTSDFYLLKTDSNGEPLWERTFEREGEQRPWSVQQTLDGGYIMAGRTERPGLEEGAYLVKTDGNGQLVWEKTFPGGLAWDVQQTTDGGYVIVGVRHQRPGDNDVWLIRTDSGGQRLWEKTFGGRGNDAGYSLQVTFDGGYIVAGATFPFGDSVADGYLLRMDPEGNRLWEKTFGGPQHDFGSSIQGTADGGYIIAGEKHSRPVGAGRNIDVYLIKLAPEQSQGSPFLRADADGNGDVNLTDAVFTLNHLFLGGPAPDCADAADADDNGDIQITDAVYSLQYLFQGDNAPQAPGPETCGPDPTEDELAECNYDPANC